MLSGLLQHGARLACLHHRVHGTSLQRTAAGLHRTDDHTSRTAMTIITVHRQFLTWRSLKRRKCSWQQLTTGSIEHYCSVERIVRQ